MKNIDLGLKVIQELLNSGVREFILCAGARNSPFVHILDENKDLKIYSFFEERSASFFALGRIAATRKPVAVITTSGTAVSELLSAAVEGTYSSLPLIMVTADRPKVYRGTGAPQAIEQVGIFSCYCEKSWDLDGTHFDFSFEGLSWKKPVHLNVCFEEPLIDAPIGTLKIQDSSHPQRKNTFQNFETAHHLEIFLQQHRPLILVGSLPDKAQETVLKFLKKYQAPVYAEGISNLRGHAELKNILIQSGEPLLQKLIESRECDSVLRLGGVPTARIWRDLEVKLKNLPVFSVSYNSYSGLSRPVQHISSLKILSEISVQPRPFENSVLLALDKMQAEKMKALLERYPLSEQGMIYALSKLMKNQRVYLGNSLPIREWDLCADQNSVPLGIAANRGANGIDGQISTFLGWAQPDHQNWCLVGDLTTLYDLSSLWATSQIAAQNLSIVVINNGGGQIFSRMFNKEIFLNRHTISFESWAVMWNWSYQQWKQIPDETNFQKWKSEMNSKKFNSVQNSNSLVGEPQNMDRQIIEVCPNAEQTRLFWKESDLLWQK